MLTGRPRFLPVFFFLEFAAECPCFSRNSSAHRNHILCPPRFSAFFLAVAPAFLSLPQPSPATARHAFFRLRLPGRNMQTAAFHQRQQEDELKHLFLYIQSDFSTTSFPRWKKSHQRLLNSSKSAHHSAQVQAGAP